MHTRIAVIGAGLCGSVLSAMLRNDFEVTVIEQGRKARPLLDDVTATAGEVTSSINRAEGLGGTTNYWHNALIEMTPGDLRKAGIQSGSLEPYYARAWSWFLSDDEREACARARDANRERLRDAACDLAHMVLPRTRANMWDVAGARHPGNPIRILYGIARTIAPGDGSRPCRVEVDTDHGTVHVDADYVLVCAGGLATPALLARSLGHTATFCPGYHDHAMAYVAKVRLRPDSRLKDVSCTLASTSEVRAGLVYESAGVKAVVYLRPAINLSLRSIQGPARYILSDLRNDPFSPRKIARLLGNIEALREAVLFKTKAGFRGDYYSLLLMGEQIPDGRRGLTVGPGRKPALAWDVTAAERAAYHASLRRFVDDFAADILDIREIPSDRWEFRTAAHHSGAAQRFVGDPGDLSLDFFAVTDLPRAFVCDGSLLRATGIANSGLTLVALSLRLAELIAASAQPSVVSSGVRLQSAVDAVGA